MISHGTSELVEIDSLLHYPGNARLHADELLRESLSTHGQYRSIVAQASTRFVIAGNGTLAAARDLGWSHISVEFVDCDDSTARKIVLIDNRSNDLAGYDDSLLRQLLVEARDDGGLPGTGFTDQDLADLLDEAETAPAREIGPYNDADVIESAFRYYRARGFPWAAMPLHERWQQVNRLALTASEGLLHSLAAYRVPDHYHPQRFTTPIPGKVTPVEAFDDDVKLRHALRLIVEDGGVITDSALLSTLGYVRGSQLAAQFRPGVALHYARRFCPEGGTWLDTSAGFGGRLVAFAASHCGRYVGIDPSTAAHEGNSALAHDLGIANRLLLLNEPAEDVSDVEPADFALTSPPYFAKERYSDEPTQSYLRYPTGEEWRDHFLLPMLRLQYDALKPGAVSVVNIADVQINSVEYPLVWWTITAAKSIGFTHMTTEVMPMPRTPGRGERPEREEPCVILRKANRRD